MRSLRVLERLIAIAAAVLLKSFPFCCCAAPDLVLTAAADIYKVMAVFKIDKYEKIVNISKINNSTKL